MIVEYIKSLLGMIKKDEVLDDLRITMKDMESLSNFFSVDQVRTAIVTGKGTLNIGLTLSKFKSSEYKKLSGDFYRYYKPTGVKKQSKLFPDIAMALKAVLVNAAYIESELEKNLENAVIKDGITAKKAILIRACDYLSFIMTYSRDLCDFLLDSEMDEVVLPPANPSDKTIQPIHPQNSRQYKEIHENIINYAKLLTIYTMSPDDFKQHLDDVPEVVMNDKTSGSVLSVYGENKVDPFGTMLTRGFKGSPIYHYGLLVAEWQAERYRLMKEKKKMLELKVMRLQLANDKTSDPKLDQEIKYIQNRVGKLEYSLHQMES